MEDAMRIMEEILETEYKGLVYINETREIGSYSRCAKKITGILLDSEQRHPGGRIEEGDIVIIADNELGNDDELTPESLETIGIADRNIEKDDALLAVGVYKNKKIQPQYKYIKSYNPNGRFELVTDYLGFEIVIRIDFAHNHVHISVNGDTYSMVYFEAVGHMVVIDSVTGKVKFFQARGYGFRGEEIGKLLAGKPYLPKTDYETSGELMPTVGLNFESIIYGDEILKEINKMFAAPDGHTESGIFEIHKRPMFCVLTRIRKGNARDGIYLILQDASLLENVRKERDSIIQALEQRQKKKFMRRPYGCDFQGAKMEDFIGEDPAMNEVKRLAYKASQTEKAEPANRGWQKRSTGWGKKTRRLWKSTVTRSRRACLKASCSDTRRARLRAPRRTARRGSLRKRTAVRSFWMKSAKSRSGYRSSCCRCCKTSGFIESAPRSRSM